MKSKKSNSCTKKRVVSYIPEIAYAWLSKQRARRGTSESAIVCEMIMRESAMKKKRENEARVMDLLCLIDSQPKPGNRIVALSSDCSAAALFYIDPSGSIHDCEYEILSHDWLIDAGYLWFSYLPINFRLWFEKDFQYPAS